MQYFTHRHAQHITSPHIMVIKTMKRGAFVNIIVLAGGRSPEREISLSSGQLVAGALAARGHNVRLLDLCEDVKNSGACKAPQGSTAAEPPSPATGERHSSPPLIGRGVLEACAAADVVFLALHGGIGEDGHLQAVLDCLGIRYTGSGFVGSLLAMDKDLTKRLLSRAGIPTAPWLCCDTAADPPERIVRRAISQLGLPCVVKPCSGGSSVGVSIAEDEDSLLRAVKSAAQCERRLLLERRLQGRELSIGILGDEALPPIEILPREGFYDYQNKYLPGRTREICPAELTDGERTRLCDCALRAFRCLRLSGYARGDFILGADGVPWCLELNTLPGMTSTSLLPQEAAAVGFSFGELCEKIIELSMK